jgi:hypothetical protein
MGQTCRMIRINIAGKSDETRLFRKYWYSWGDNINTELGELVERMYTALHCLGYIMARFCGDGSCSTGGCGLKVEVVIRST